MKVYIIQACDDSWSSDLEIVTATLDKEKAKKKLKEIIAEHIENAKDSEDWDDIKENFNYTKKNINRWVNDMVEGKAKGNYEYSSDEFPGGNVWCEVVELE